MSRPSEGSFEADSIRDASGELPHPLNSALLAAGMAPIEICLAARFTTYLSLILRWNQRVNLTAIRDEQGIIGRHFVESIACARALPLGINSLLDLGSGAGFPGIPIAICRPEISVNLAESQGKKAAFLQEALRQLGLSAKVHSRRAEELCELFDCVTMRAVDHMKDAVQIGSRLVKPGGWLALMTTVSEAADLQSAAGAEFAWNAAIPLTGSSERVIALGQKKGPPPEPSIKT
jgi:16S rRNA (guanine527-N7)-methyltransferase